MSAENFDTLFGDVPLMAILRGFGPTRTLELARRAWSLGVACVEIPVQTPADEEALALVADEAVRLGCVVGAGTVLTPHGVARVHELGARFTVSPGFDREVAHASLNLDMPHLPGVATATEVHHARAFGLTWLKAFPAGDLGSGWITSILAPFPDVNIVATGGITAHNATQFLTAGARAVAVGSALADPTQLGLLTRLMAASHAAI